MKKFVIVGLLAVVTVFGAFAESAGVAMTATVSQFTSITLPATYAFGGNISETGSTVATTYGGNIGNIAVVTNLKSWHFTVESANYAAPASAGGSLYNATASTGNQLIPYTLAITLPGSNSWSGTLAADTMASTSMGKTLKAGSTYATSLQITSSGTAFWEAGAYVDTLTVSVVAD